MLCERLGAQENRLMTSLPHRAFRSLSLEPGGLPSRQARIANRVIRTTMRTAWAAAPNTDAGLRAVRWGAARLPGLVPSGVKIVPESFGLFSGEWVRAKKINENQVFIYL